MLSKTAMGMRKMGIMELMIWRVNPVPVRRPMVQTTLSIATSMAATTKTNLRKK
jgi:hypothetical protein